jgi:hypothetical protein
MTASTGGIAASQMRPRAAAFAAGDAIEASRRAIAREHIRDRGGVERRCAGLAMDGLARHAAPGRVVIGEKRDQVVADREPARVASCELESAAHRFAEALEQWTNERVQRYAELSEQLAAAAQRGWHRDAHSASVTAGAS